MYCTQKIHSKRRFSGHKYSFNPNNKNATTLSQYIWKLKDKGIRYSLKWRVLDRGKAFTPGSKDCKALPQRKATYMYLQTLQPEQQK